MTVYFLKSGATGDNIKIGTSGNLARRVTQFNLPGAEIVATVAGGADKERQLHERFQRLRIDNSEWFENGPALTEFVDSLQRPGTVSDLWARATSLYGEVTNGQDK